MKALSKRAEAIFRKLTEGLVKPGDHKKVDNTNGSFMPVSIDVLEVAQQTIRVSLAHNHIQNGDVMADPDVEFLVTPTGILPLTFQQDPGIYHRWAWQQDGEWRYNPRGQADLTSFCNQWLININDQQNLGVK
jgi:hypothetical protein